MEKSNSDLIREAAEADLECFIRLVAPRQVLGSVHTELMSWWTRQEKKSHQIVLLPRDHQKSRMVAYRVAWRITRQPDVRILYISATSNLAEKQLKWIKDILTSPIYRRYWPDMINEDENKREKWTNSEIAVDHPKRKEEGIRDPTVFTGGLTTSLTGMHCDVAVMDDVVVYENAYTEEGRNRVKSQYSLLVSIMGAEEEAWVVGTRYHPKDLYNDLLVAQEILFDNNGDETGSENIYEVFERAVEDRGDMTGQFLWPKQQRSDGQWFGFDTKVLSKKKGQYLNKSQFRAQYYNDPNDSGDARIDRSKFQYYDKVLLSDNNGGWYYKDKKLNVFAAVDFAFSVKERADYTAIAVVGIDRDGYIYVLEIDRFKTDKISEYFKHILDLHTKWDFRRLSAEVSVAQQAIVRELKDSYIRPYGLNISIVETKPTRHQGSKEERLAAILEPKYDNQSILHYKGGNCQTLEDELIMSHPPHDDCMDALASAIEIAVPPSQSHHGRSTVSNISAHPKYGGMRF